MHVRILGDLDVTDAGHGVSIRGAKQRLLLVILVLRRGNPASNDQLVELLWGDEPPRNPANAVQAHVSQLRRALPAGTVLAGSAGYGLDPARITVDVDEMRALADRARELAGRGETGAARAALVEALGQWRGPALADLGDHDAIAPHAERLAAERLALLHGRLELDLQLGYHRDVLPELEQVCAEHPFAEGFIALRMLALYRSGRQADALRVYADARATLVDELGVDPGPELRELERRVLAHDRELLVTATERPATRGVPQARRTNIRHRMTRFIGRADVVADVVADLDASRLVTLIGPGGTGKTRLAVEVAASVLDRFPGGVWLVELAAVSDPVGLGPAIVAALGNRERAPGGASTNDRLDPVDRDDLAELVGLLDGPALLVVDNCEHLVDAAAATCEALLRGVGSLRILATSREALAVDGERIRPVRPLPLVDAVQLFHDRAAAARPDLSLDRRGDALAEVCRRLDGLPLAIELAAARLRTLPLDQLVAGLDDRFRVVTGGPRSAAARQQTLRAVVDWSYAALGPAERQAFERLSVFAAPAAPDAAAAVCDTGAETADLLDRLAQKSLVTVEADPHVGVRYGMLETLREYGRERLAEQPVDARATRVRHAQWFRDRATTAGAALRGDAGQSSRRLLEAERPDLQLALDWLVDHGDRPNALRLAVGVCWLWFLRSDPREALRWLDEALAASPGDDASGVAQMAAMWHAYFSCFVSDPEEHYERGEAALAALRARARPGPEGVAGMLLASALIRGGRCERALDVLASVAEPIDRGGESWSQAMVDLLRSSAELRLGRLDDAQRSATDSVGRFEEIGERWSLLEPLGNLAAIQVARGDLAGALTEYDRLVSLARDHELPGYWSMWTVSRAVVLARLGDHQRVVAEVDAMLEATPTHPLVGQALIVRARSASRLGRHAAALDDIERGAGELARSGGPPGAGAAAAVARSLCRLDAGDVAAAEQAAADAAALDAEMTALALAALAVHREQLDGARTLLDRWSASHQPLVPASPAGVLASDRDLLARRAGLTA